MENKKNLKNLGFTIYEALAVIVIIGVIASITIPVVITNQKKYNKTVFEQNSKMYEKVFLDVHKKFTQEYYGTTSLTNKVKIKVPFVNKITTEEDVCVDLLDTTYAGYFIYETLVGSNYSYENFKVEYSPATITSKFKYFTSCLSLKLDDGTIIYYNMEVITTAVNSNQIAYIRSVDIVKEDMKYSFTV